MVIVTGSIQARLDTFDELRRLSLEHVARSRAEPGCLEHGVAIDANDGLRLVFFERWADRDALLRTFACLRRRAFAAAGARASPRTRPEPARLRCGRRRDRVALRLAEARAVARDLRAHLLGRGAAEDVA
jgi:quinol monooxygenase YgiN